MKKRTFLIGSILTIIPIGQPIFLGTASLLTSAAAIYSLSVRAESQGANFCFKRGNNKADNGDLEGAISDYTKAIKLDPDFGDAYSNRATVKIALGDYEGAIFDSNKGLELLVKEKVQISIKDIITPKMIKRRTLMWKAYNRFAGFNGETYEKPITYYVHDENTKNVSKNLPKLMRNSFEISNDEKE